MRNLTLITSIILFSLLLSIKPAIPHEFYDHDCCSDADCAPEIKNEYDPTRPGGSYITTKHGRAWVPEGPLAGVLEADKIRPSPDGKVHVCMTAGKGDWARLGDEMRAAGEEDENNMWYPKAPFVDPKLLCVYLPPKF